MTISKDEAYINIGKYFAGELSDECPAPIYTTSDKGDYWYARLRSDGSRFGVDKYIVVSKKTGAVSVRIL